ncbi:MAG: adenylate/guanylate cyclase domain-containing protein [Pseudomonadota bacterium]
MQRSWNKIETLEEALGRIAELEEEIERLKKAPAGGGACGTLHGTKLTPGGTILGLEELVLTVDAEGRVSYVNRPMARFLGVESRRAVAGAVLASIDRTALGRGFFRGIIEAARGSREPCAVERECPGLDPDALPGPGGRERPRTAPFLRIVATARGGAANIVVQDVTAIKWLERNFARYVTPEVLACMYETPDADFFSPIRKEISILFGDLRGFTRMSSEMPPERVHETVNSFFCEMVACAGLYGGSVDKFVGDEIMLLFGAPLPLQDHALRGLCCAAGMQARHRRWMKRRRDGGLAATPCSTSTQGAGWGASCARSTST